MKNKTKYLVMDVDGTLTDGKIYMGGNGEICKAFSIKDGYGIHDILTHEGIIPIIITGRESQILINRCQELGIDNVHQGIKNKIAVLDKILLDSGDDYSNVAYIGDDCNDLSCMLLIKKSGGLVGCPADAVKQVIEVSDFISMRNGGNGAVRDFIDWIIKKTDLF